MTTNNEAFEKWAFENKFVLEKEDEIYTFSITRLAHQTWQAATTEANKRIAELESKLSESNHSYITLQDSTTLIANKYLESQASNNHLREALDNIVNTFYEETDVAWMRQCYDLMELGKQALSTTLAESLQAHNDEVIEKCAKVCEGIAIGAGKGYAEAIRALKEVK